MGAKIWTKPIDLEQLLTELPDGPEELMDAVVVVMDDDEGTLALTGAEAAKVLASTSTVSQFFEALGNPGDASIEIDKVEIPDEIFDELERLFDYVEID